MGKKVLTVDFDSQANLTTCYGVEDTGALEYTIGHLMMAQIEEEVPESFEDYIQSREDAGRCVGTVEEQIRLYSDEALNEVKRRRRYGEKAVTAFSVGKKVELSCRLKRSITRSR